MMKTVSAALIILLFLAGCGKVDKYSFNKYYDAMEQDSVEASVINYIFIPPNYTSKGDRFKPEHRKFYVEQLPKFYIEKYFVAEDGTNFYLIVRPGPTPDQWRAVGGHFKMGEHFRLKKFREEFVTPLLSEKDMKERGGFLFDEMVKGTLGQFLDMKTFAQWPNEISFYDTVFYEWAIDPGNYE